jgi:hypothetical protein
MLNRIRGLCFLWPILRTIGKGLWGAFSLGRGENWLGRNSKRPAFVMGLQAYLKLRGKFLLPFGVGRYVEASISNEINKGFGILVSGDDSSIGEDDGGNTLNTYFISESHIFIHG